MIIGFPTAPPAYGLKGPSADVTVEKSLHPSHTEILTLPQSWKNREAVEMATLAWVDWFNHRRLFEPLGHRPPAEAEAAYYAQVTESALAA